MLFSIGGCTGDESPEPQASGQETAPDAGESTALSATTVGNDDGGDGTGTTSVVEMTTTGEGGTTSTTFAGTSVGETDGVATGSTTGDAIDALLEVDFENHPGGEYTEPQMDADFGWFGEWQNGLGEGRTDVLEEGGNHFLRCLFREGTRGHIQWQADLGGVHEDVYLRYRVRFVGEDFDFRSGGKLPGLAGGTAPTGGQNSSDGLGFSARFMWRNTVSNATPFFTQYMYDMDKEDGSTGRHLTLGGDAIYVEPDRWYEVRSHIVMNTPGEADGRIEVWLDDVSVLQILDARLRSSADLGTDMLYFSTFFGGSNTTQYQTSKDEYIDYDDFLVWSGG